MKVVIEKNLKAGSYLVNVEITEYSEDEIDRVKRFGAPSISIAPETIYYNGRARSVIPVTSLNTSFQFSDEQSAEDFIKLLKSRIKSAVDELKGKTDNFSGRDEIEL